MRFHVRAEFAVSSTPPPRQSALDEEYPAPVVIITDITAEDRPQIGATITVIDHNASAIERLLVGSYSAIDFAKAGSAARRHPLNHAEEDQHIQAAGDTTRHDAIAKAMVDQRNNFTSPTRLPASR